MRRVFPLFAGTGRLLAGAALLLILASASTTVAQTSPCYTVICPTNQTKWVCSQTDQVPLGPYPITILTNPCPTLPPLTVNCTPPPGTLVGPGTYTVTCGVFAGGVILTNCQFQVQVNVDNQPPQIQCPPDLTVAGCPTATGGCAAVVNYPPPVATDNSGPVTVTCIPPSGANFMCGVTTVSCTAVDRCQRATTCTFKVTVTNLGQPPSIQCPPNLTADTCSNCVPVLYPAPIPVNGVLTGCAPASGSCFPLGVTTVTCTATNLCGTRTCSFTITVRAVPPATLVCPSNIVATVPCLSNCVPVLYPAPVVTGGTLISCTPPSGTCLPVGTHVVNCRATNDCGDLSGCDFLVQVVGGTGHPPTITCPPDITVETCGNCEVVNYPPPVVLGGGLAGCSPPSGSCFPVGINVVTCLATNDCGGTALCAFRVIVRPESLATIVCPPDLTVTTCGNCEVVNYPAPVVVNGTLIGCSPPSGFCFPIGVTSVTCRATNACGVLATCKFDVTVREVPPIGILCPTNIVVTTCTNGEVVTYPPPTIVGTAVSVVCVPPSGTFFPLGTNVVTCCAVDQCQRTACCSFTVTVLPGQPCVKPPLNMVLWLPFDEPAGPIAHNIVAGAPNGVHANGPTPLLGQHVLNSLCFDGVNDFVRVPNYAAIQLNVSHFTIDTWALRRDPTVNGGRRVIVSKMSQVPGGIAGYEFYHNNGVMNLLLRTPLGAANFNSGVVVPNDNNWHFLAVTVQRGAPNTVRFYLDGAPVATVSLALNGGVGNSSSLLVGSRSFPGLGDYFLGCLDELEIFRRILTPAEINSLWRAGKAGKCKITKSVPWDVPFPPGSNCVTVNVRVCNLSAAPQPILWNASGPLPITTPGGTLIIPPFTCTNIPVTLCRPTNAVPVGGILIWNFALSPAGHCPMVMMGSVINPGPIVVTVPTGPTPIPGTNQTVNVRIGLNGLPPGQPVRLRAIGPDMEPDQVALSLNGLPPGVPWIRSGGGFSPASDDFDVPIRFVEADPIGGYTILIETDLDGDGQFNTLVSFDVENPVVAPPTLSIRKAPGGSVKLDWNDEGDGYGTLESTDDVVHGPWSPVPGGSPGMLLPAVQRQQYFRVSMPLE